MDVYRNGFFYWYVVSIGDLVDVCCVGFVSVCKFGWVLVLYWFFYELVCVDDDSEDDEEEDGVVMIEVVDLVIVVCFFEFGDGGDCFKYVFYFIK